MDTMADEDKNDIKVLRELGKKISDIASDPVNEERKKLWNRLNSLELVRPLVFIFEIPWHEMEYERELTPLCSNDFLRAIEINLRRKIYQWRHMPADMVVERIIYSPLAVGSTGIGLTEKFFSRSTDNRSDIISRRFNIQIKTEADLEKIKTPVITHNEEESNRRFCLLREIFHGILPVKKRGITQTSIAPWDVLVRFTGINEILSDMILRPDYVHKAISRIFEAYIRVLAQYNRLNLLSLNNDNSFLGGGLQYTDELPAPGFDPGHVRPEDIWGRTMSQIFSAVSPGMHDEFALCYERKYLSQFGLSYYGCCEPLHKKINILRQIPNLRKISMSPWVDAEEGAAVIGQDYVYSMKANPSLVGWENWDPETAREDLEDNLKKTKNCPTEIILKDISTVRYQPQRLWEWSEIAVQAASSL